MKPQVKQEDREAIDAYLGSLKIDEPASPGELRDMLRSAIGDRGLMIYLVWKVLWEKHPEIDATEVLREACFRFGEIKGSEMGEAATPAEWLKKLSSRGGILAWDQTVVELNEDKASKVFLRCPHMETARAAGATDEELAQLCRKIMMDADFGTLKPFPHLELAFPDRTCGEGGHCVMVVTRKA
jgi:hypothetical protein